MLSGSDQELKEEDYVLFPTSLKPYKPHQINMIFSQWLREKQGVLIKIEDYFSNIKISTDAAGWIFSNIKTNEKVALFKVANFPSAGYYNPSCPTLRVALKSYIKKGIQCKKLIIPIAELGRNHFRLLIIKPDENQAIFYDSKSKIVGSVSEVLSSSSSAINKILQAQPPDFIENFTYMSKTCQSFFPKIEFSSVYLGDQDKNNNEDCGPFTLEYAEKILMGSNVPTNIDVQHARGKHEEMFKEYLNNLPTALEDKEFRLKICYGDEDSIIKSMERFVTKRPPTPIEMDYFSGEMMFGSQDKISPSLVERDKKDDEYDFVFSP